MAKDALVTVQHKEGPLHQDTLLNLINPRCLCLPRPTANSLLPLLLGNALVYHWILLELVLPLVHGLHGV